MSKAPAFGSPAAVAYVEAVRLERAYLSDLHVNGFFDDVLTRDIEPAEAKACELRLHLKRRELEYGHFEVWHGAQQDKLPEEWEGKEFQFHPTYWYVKALIVENKLKKIGLPLDELPDELYYPTHDWLLFKGAYGPWWARGLPEGDYAPEDEVEDAS